MKNIKSIAILENDELTLRYNETVVRHSNFNGCVNSFSHSDQLTDYATNSDLNYTSLLLLDLNSVRLNAFSVLDELRKSYSQPSYRVVILGLRLTEKDKEKAQEYHEIVQILEKPFSIPTLNSLLQMNLAVA